MTDKVVSKSEIQGGLKPEAKESSLAESPKKSIKHWQFKKGGPGGPGRPKGTSPIDAIRKQLAESGDQLMRVALAEATEGKNTKLLSDLLKFLLASKRAAYDPVVVPGAAEAATLQGKTAAVLEAVTDGLIPADVGQSILAGYEKAEAAQKIEALTARLDSLTRVVEGRILNKGYSNG